MLGLGTPHVTNLSSSTVEPSQHGLRGRHLLSMEGTLKKSPSGHFPRTQKLSLAKWRDGFCAHGVPSALGGDRALFFHNHQSGLFA